MAGPRYRVIEKIDVGGMAEVWKGCASSIETFEKLVAIKRVLPSLVKNKKFMAMFLDEARLALHLNHTNIVQTFDVGRSQTGYFIVMEWVDGANLKKLLEIASRHHFTFPIEQALFVAIEVCKGLSHAHERTDRLGNPLNIVHRDVSPPNVLISREGEVKLVDFGLARAASQLTLTDPGVVKGKFGYLCPEAARGKKVGQGADIFATGVILWEALAGRRLFLGENDLETVKQVRSAQIPSLAAFNPKVDADLEHILAKALAREPEDRFQSSEEFGHALSKYLFRNQLMVTSYDLAITVRKLLKCDNDHHTEPVQVERPEVATPVDRPTFGTFETMPKLTARKIPEAQFEEQAITENLSDSVELADSIDTRDWMEEFVNDDADGDMTILDSHLGAYIRDALERDNETQPSDAVTTKMEDGLRGSAVETIPVKPVTDAENDLDIVEQFDKQGGLADEKKELTPPGPPPLSIDIGPSQAPSDDAIDSPDLFDKVHGLNPDDPSSESTALDRPSSEDHERASRLEGTLREADRAQKAPPETSTKSTVESQTEPSAADMKYAAHGNPSDSLNSSGIIAVKSGVPGTAKIVSVNPSPLAPSSTIPAKNPKSLHDGVERGQDQTGASAKAVKTSPIVIGTLLGLVVSGVIIALSYYFLA